MGMNMNINGLEFPSYLEELREIVTTVETRLRPIPEMRGHVSRFMDGADMDEVFPSLYLGDCDAASNEQYLLRHGITHVLNCAGNTTGPAPVKTGPNYYKNPSIVYAELDLIDLPFINIAVHFERASKIIHNALKNGGKVLVHCRQGRSRSAAIVAAFLMIHRQMTAEAALRMLRKNREIRPNNGFLQQLADLDLKLFRTKLEKMRRKLSRSDSDLESEDKDERDSCSDSSEAEDQSSDEEEQGHQSSDESGISSDESESSSEESSYAQSD